MTEANGHAERIAALHMIELRANRPTPIMVGADAAGDFVNELRSTNATSHMAQNANGARRRSAAARRDTRATL